MCYCQFHMLKNLILYFFYILFERMIANYLISFLKKSFVHRSIDIRYADFNLLNDVHMQRNFRLFFLPSFRCFLNPFSLCMLLRNNGDQKLYNVLIFHYLGARGASKLLFEGFICQQSPLFIDENNILKNS